MYVAMLYFVFMEVMVSDLIHGGTILIFGAHVSQFQFCRLVGKGGDGPCGATLMLNPMMQLRRVSFLCVLPCTIWTSFMSFSRA